MTRVAIVAATPMLRAGLRAVLTRDEMQVVGEAASLEDLAPLLSETDVLVVAGESVLADASQMLDREERLALVLLADEDQAADLLRSLPLRGWGLVTADAGQSELLAAVEAAAEGLVVLPYVLGEKLLSRPLAGGIVRELGAEPLSVREREVLDLMGQGLSNKQIGRRLQISEHTVKYHVSSIFAKLGASSRTEAVSRGARQGLITL